MTNTTNASLDIDLLVALGVRVRQACMESLRREDVLLRSRMDTAAGADVMFGIDNQAEAALVEELEAKAGAIGGVVLVAEGVSESGERHFPSELPADKCRHRLLIDPIDGTRGLMFDKRPAFFLAGLAPNRGESTRLADIASAIMLELPTSRQYLADAFWARRGEGTRGFRDNLITGERSPIEPRPYAGNDILGGFAQLARFFPPAREALIRVEERMWQELIPPEHRGRAVVFEDQYISTGGQIYELLTGKDRFTADLRALAARHSDKNLRGLCCHPYDLAAILVATEAGIPILSSDGAPLDAPLDCQSDVDWMGFANAGIRDKVLPALHRSMEREGWRLS